MKNRLTFRTLWLAAALPLALAGCTKTADDPAPPAPPAGGTVAAGTFAWTEGGTAQNGVVQAHTLPAASAAGKYTLTLSGATAPGSSGTNNDQVTLTLLNITGPGTYALGINTATSVLASATFYRNRVGSPTAIWGAGPGLGGGVGAGSVTLTTFNPTARTAAGTFSFTGGPVTNTNGVNTVAVTNGAFNVVIP